MGVTALFLTLITAVAESAEIELRIDNVPIEVFGGGLRKIELGLHNSGAQTIEMPVQLRLLQASFATVAPCSTQFWKTLKIMAGQTIIESAELNLPAVQAKTQFLGQWIANDGHVIGISKLVVYPTNLLNELRVLSGNQPIGVFDPSDTLRRALQTLDTVNLQEYPAGGFDGKFAVVTRGPDPPQAPDLSATWANTLARHGAAVVWLQSPPEQTEPLQPSFYTVRRGAGTIVVAQSFLVSDLADDPKSQLNLIELARAAVRPDYGTFHPSDDNF